MDRLPRRRQRHTEPRKIPKNARNAPNFDYLDPGHINPHPAYKSPKFGLKRGKNGKCHATSYSECPTKTLYQAKHTPKYRQKTRGAPQKDAPITRPPPGRRANMYKPKPPAKIPINTTPRTKIHKNTQKTPVPKNLQQKNSEKYTQKGM